MSIQYITYLACNFIFVFGMHLFYSKFFFKEEKTNRWIHRATLILYIFVDFLLYVKVSNPYVFPILGFLTYFAVTLAYHWKINYRNFLAAVWILAFGICSELLASYLVSYSMGKLGMTTSENAIVAALISARLFFFLMTYAASRLTRYQKEGGPMRYVAILTIFLPLISIGLVIYIFSLAEFDQNTILNTDSIGAVVSVVAILWINMVTIWLFDRQSHAYYTEREAQVLRKTIQIQQEHYNGEIEKREAIRKIKHDYKNFLLAIQADLSSGKEDDIKRIIDGELAKDVIMGLPQSGWYSLDAILSYKEAAAQKAGFRILPEFWLESEPRVASEDICVMLGNALDNAIEYLTVHPACSKEIEVHVRYEKGILNIKVRNEVEKAVAVSDKRFCMSSKMSEEHGYGLKSIDYIAGKYGGRLILSCEGNTFECGMLLYCESITR